MRAGSSLLGIGCVLALLAPRPALSANFLNLESLSSSFDMTTGGFTVECWVKFASLGYNPRIVKALGPGTQIQTCGQVTQDGWVLLVCTSDCPPWHPRFGIQDGVECPTPADADVKVCDGNYHHLAATYDGNVMSLYVDGIPAGQSTVGARQVTVAGGRLRIGDPESAANPPDISAPFDGAIDELRIWSYARSQSQIANNMNSEISNQAGLVACWRFNNSSLVDQVSGLTLTATGIVSFEQGHLSGGVKIGDGTPSAECAPTQSAPSMSPGVLIALAALLGAAGASQLRRLRQSGSG